MVDYHCRELINYDLNIILYPLIWFTNTSITWNHPETNILHKREKGLWKTHPHLFHFHFCLSTSDSLSFLIDTIMYFKNFFSIKPLRSPVPSIFLMWWVVSIFIFYESTDVFLSTFIFLMHSYHLSVLLF